MVDIQDKQYQTHMMLSYSYVKSQKQRENIERLGNKENNELYPQKYKGQTYMRLLFRNQANKKKVK